MTELLPRAVSAIERLPEGDQDEIATRLLDELEEREWDRLINSPESLRVLRRMAAEAIAEDEWGETRDLDEVL